MTGGRGATVPDRGRQSRVARTRLARQPPRGFWLGVARALAPDPVLALLVARRGDAPRLRPGRGAAGRAGARRGRVRATGRASSAAGGGPVDGNAGGRGARACSPGDARRSDGRSGDRSLRGTEHGRHARSADRHGRARVCHRSLSPRRESPRGPVRRGLAESWGRVPRPSDFPRAGNPCPTDRCRTWTETTPWRARSPRAATGGRRPGCTSSTSPTPLSAARGRRGGRGASAARGVERRRARRPDDGGERLRRQRLRLDAVPVAG